MAATFSASNLFAKAERPLAIKGKGDIALSTWAFLFSEVVQYCQTKVTNIGELERRSVAHITRPTRHHGTPTTLSSCRSFTALQDCMS